MKLFSFGITRVFFAALVPLSVFAGCAMGPVVPPMTALQIRTLQTREYQTTDTKMVMKAVLNTLQDQGFVTRNAVMDLGLITAIKESDMQTPSGEIWNSILIGHEGAWAKQRIIEATANVSEFDNMTRIRISFKRKTLSNRGDTLDIAEVTEPGFYQDFFSDIDKGIFLQRERL